jgi:hypothetical protein
MTDKVTSASLSSSKITVSTQHFSSQIVPKFSTNNIPSSKKSVTEAKTNAHSKRTYKIISTTPIEQSGQVGRVVDHPDDRKVNDRYLIWPIFVFNVKILYIIGIMLLKT